MSAIPFFNMRDIHVGLKQEIFQAIDKVYDRGGFILGEEVVSFEEEFATYCDSQIAIGVSNGLDALKLILKGLEIGPDDEVILPTNSFIATALAVTDVGAKVVFADVSEKTYNLTVETVKSKITHKTKAVICVHLYGQISDLDGLVELCREADLYFIEDAAQAHGARYKGKKAGCFGVAAAFSFYPAKNLGALGDGGCIVTSNSELAEKIKLLRNYGSKEKYKHLSLGYNCRLDELQAAVLRVKLKYLDEWNISRKQIASAYCKNLNPGKYTTPFLATHSDPAWHVFCVLVSDRALVRAKLMASGVPTLIHYPTPIHLQSAYSCMNHNKGSFPVSEWLAEHCLSLPIWPGLNAEEVIMRANAVKD